MIKEASTGIAEHRAVKNKLIQNVWRANVNPKLKESVPNEQVRMGLQAMAWAAMMTILLVVIILVTIRTRCVTESTLLSVTEVAAKEDDGYACEPISAVPQEFDGQTYYETAYWWGFGVSSAWGTFNGSSWEDYCADLMAEAGEVMDFETLVDPPQWTHSFDTADGTNECTYTTAFVAGLNTFPNAPGSDNLGCSYPTDYGNCTLDDLDTVTGAEIPAAWSRSDSSGPDDPFCPDFILWHPFSVRLSPLDFETDIPRLCSVWGQDIGIVSRAVESCTKELCKEWYSILSTALALAAGAQAAVILVIVLSYKVSEYLEEKKRREQGGGSEEKDNDEEKEETEDAEKELKSVAKEAGKALFNAGKSITEAVV